MKILQIPASEWASLSEDAHAAVFQTFKPVCRDRIDYALLAVEEDLPLGYLTAREIDSESVFWQFGGAFPSIKGTVKSLKAYQQFVSWTAPRYERVSTLIENSNLPMLKFAMQVGFRITGLRNFNGSVLLEHTLEFSKKGI